MPDLSQAFSLADLIGSPLLTQYLGDSIESLAEDLLVYPDPQTPGGWLLAIQLNGTIPEIPLVGDALSIDLSGLPGSSASSDSIVFAKIAISTGPFQLTISPYANVRIKVSPDYLTPLDGSDAVYFGAASGSGAGVFDGIGITFSAAGVSWVSSSGPLTLALPQCQVGETGVQINGGTVTLALWGTNGSTTLPALGITDSFRGIVLQNISLILPSDLVGLGAIQVPFATISRTGVSGTVSLNPVPAAGTVSLFGATIVPQSISVTIAQNSLTGATLAATMTLPFFEQPVAVAASISDGAWSLNLSTGGTTITGPGFSLVLVSLGIEHDDGKTWYKLNGTLTPQVPDFPFPFPALDLTNVLIDGLGQIKASGGSMTLSSQKVFQLGDVLTAKLTKFGFGGDGANGRYITLSGGIDLIEGLPLEAQFDTLKVSWSTSGGAPSLTLEGATIDIGIPDLFDFGGSLKYVNGLDSNGDKEVGFTGSIHLSIIPAQMEIDGHFAVLEVTQNPNTSTASTFTALGIELNLTLPAAIPLMQTNLGIYGFNGLVAWNYGPNLPGYNNDWFQWFMGRPTGWAVGQAQEVGVVDTSPTSTIFTDKWGPDPTKKGAGAGFTIGTMVDTGFSWHARATFIVLVPGPDLILAGECNFVSLQPGMDSAVTGAFELMIAYDGDNETLNAAISAQVGKDPIFYASGAANAFFDFNNPGAWYLDIGTKAIPIQATVAKMLNGTAYLDLSSNELDAGAQAGYSGNFQAGPLKASVSAHVGFDATLTRRPLRLTGDATLEGSMKLSAWKITANVGLNADITMDAMVLAGPQPNVAYKFHFEIQAELQAKVLFMNLSAKETIQVTVTSPQDPDNPDPPVYPVKAISLELPAHTAETWPLPLTHAQTPSSILQEDSVAEPPAPAQGVPPDSLPTLVFGVPVYDQDSIGTNPPLDGSIQIGNASYDYTLVSIVIKDSGGNIVYSTIASDQASPTSAIPIWGQWCEELGNRGKTRLQLFADNPYFLSLRTTPANGLADSAAARGPSPCTGVSETVTGACVSLCDFPWTTVDSGAETFLMDGAESDGFVFDVRGPRPCAELPINASHSGDSRGCWAVVEPGDSLTLPSPAALIQLTAVAVTLPGHPVRRLNPLRVPAATSVKAFDAAGHSLHIHCTRTPSGTDADFEIRIPTANAVRLVFEHALALSIACIFNEQQAQQIENAPTLNSQLTTALQSGASGTLTPAPFKPWASYTIEVTVSVQGAGGSGQFVDTVAFTTGGPPGVLGQNPPAVSNANGYPFAGPLENLDRYAAASIPQADADRAYPFDNAYRGYDPGVIFNEEYVIAMYEAASASPNPAVSLVLDVVDANGNSLTAEAAGQIASTPTTSPSLIDRFRGLWGSRLSNQCGITQLYPPNDALTLPLDPRIALSPRCQYSVQVSAGLDASGNPQIPYRQGFSSSRFLTVTHHIQSHPDAAFALRLDSTASFSSLSQVSGIPAGNVSVLPIPNLEAALFDQITSDLALSPAAPRETLDGSALYATDGTCRALLFTTPEPLPWDRITIDSAAFDPSVTPIIRPTRVTITDLSINPNGQSYVEIMLLEDGDPSGITVSSLSRAARVPHRTTITQTIYSFESEGVWPSGTIFRLYDGQAPSPTPDIQARQLSIAKLPTELLSIDANQGSRLLHRRQNLKFTSTWNFQIVRKRDGSAFFLVPTDANASPVNLSPGQIKFSLTINRNLEAADPGGLRLWTRCGSTLPTEGVAWHVRIPKPN